MTLAEAQGTTTLEPGVTSTRPVLWRFFLAALPFGIVANGFNAIALPVLLRQAGISVDVIGTIAAALLLPLVFQFVWTILIDGRVRAGRMLAVTATLSALLMTAALTLHLPSRLAPFVALILGAQLSAALSFACSGALVASTVPVGDRGRATGSAMAGVLGGGALGGTLLTYLASTRGQLPAAIALCLLTVMPALAALGLDPPTVHGTPRVSAIGEVKRILKSAEGRRLLLFASSPAGAGGLLTLLSAVAEDYHASVTTVAIANGVLGAVFMAAGSLIGGIACDRAPARRQVLWAVAATALGCVAIGMALLPISPISYVVGVLGYDLCAGICLAVFPVVVLDVVAKSPMSLTLYAFFYGVGVIPTTYSALTASRFHGQHGPRGLLVADGLLNLAGALLLATVLLVIRSRATRRPRHRRLTPSKKDR